MAQTVKLKRSAVAAKVPLTSDLALGELAANTCDGVLYTLMNDGTNKVVQVGGQSVSATVTAGTNAQGQGPLTSNVNLVTTTTANPSGVTLPTALLGRKLLVFNRGTNPINVYPATGAQIDALGTNVSIQIPVKGWLEFNATSTTQWYSSFGAFINNGSNIYSSISKAPGSNSENFFAGTCAGSSTGNYNTHVGYCAGALSSGGDCNIFFGKYAGLRTTGDKNNFFGPYAGCSTLGGYSNNFFGDFAGYVNTTGCYNVFMGSGAGGSNLTASNNIAIGRLPGYTNTTGANNIFFGNESGWANTTSSNVIAVGNRAGYFNRGDRNVFLGQDTGYLTGRLTYITGADNFITGLGAGASLTTGCRNTFIGVNAGCGATGANCNLIVGWNAGKLNGTGRDNIFLGACTGAATAGGIANVFIGRYAGAYASSSTQNVFIGAYAGSYNNAGGQNVFLGTNSGYCNTTGCNNYFVGFSSGLRNTTGSGNFFVGCTAGNCNTTTSGSIAIGNRAGFWNQGNQNIYLGQDAGYVVGRLNTTTGSENFVVGCNAGARITTGSKNIIIGCKAGSNADLTGGSNHLFGAYAGYALTSGRYNNFFGLNSGCGVTTGQYNNYFGYLTGQYSNGSGNFFAGRQAGYCSTGSDNLFIGNLSGTDNTSGGCNIGLGWLSARYNTTGTENVFIGSQAGQANTVTGASVAIGCNAGYWNNGASNIYIGNCAGRSATRAACTTGANNLVVGRQSGLNITTGAQNSFLGAYAGCLTTTGSCNVIVGGFTGTGFTTSSNHIFLSDGAGTNRLMFNNSGALGLNGANYGTAGQALISCGNALPPQWGTVTASVADGDKGDITVSGTGTVWTIDANAVTNAKLAQVATSTLKGRVTAATGNVEDLTGTQATTLLDTFTSALKGLAPASGGGTTNFLRADGTWAAPVGSDVSLAANNPFTGANTFTNATGQIFRTAATQDGLLLRGRAGGTGSFTMELVPATLAANVTVTIPASTSTLVNLASTQTMTGAKTFQSATGILTYSSASTQDGLIIKGNGAGTGSFRSTIQPTTLTASRTFTLPNVDGTAITTGDTATVTNTMLANSAITVNGTSTSLGGSVSLFAGTTTLQTASANQALTGISSVTLPGATSGTVLLQPAAVAGTTTITLPSTTGTVITTGDSGTVTNTMLAQVATGSFKGRATAGTGNVEDLTGTQATALLDTFTSALKGLAPASGGGTTNFLRADGTWAAPPSSTAAGSNGQIQYNSSGAFAGNANLTFDSGTNTLATGAFSLPDGSITDNVNGTRLTNTTTGQYVQVSNTINGGVTITGPLNFTAASRQIQYTVSGAGKIATLPDNTGVLIGTGDVGTVTGTMIATETITNTDVSLTAAISGTKISPDFGAQLIQTSANPGLLLTGSVTGATTNQGVLAQGSLGFTGARVGANFADTQAQYFQVVLQNKSSNTNASCDFVVCNDASTDTTNYGNFGINSSTYSGTGVFNQPGTVYLTSSGGPLGLGTTTANDIRFSYNSEATDSLTIGATAATFGKSVLLKAGTATDAPLDFTSGTLLTTPIAGAVEYLDSHFYSTPTTTSGRGFIPSMQTFRLTANGTAIGGTIADFYGANSSINLAANAVYEIKFFAYLQKNTAGTLTWTLTASSAPTLISSIHRAGPVTGIAAGAPTTLYTGSRGATTAAFGATGSISNNAFMAYEFQTQVITNLATNFRLRITCSAGTVVAQAGSFYTVTQISPTTGSFAA